MSDLIVNDPPCPECGAQAVELECVVCKRRGRVVVCGHEYDLPRPLALGTGVDFGRVTCERCEERQDRIAWTLQRLSGGKASEVDLTLMREAVNIALLKGVNERKTPPGLTEDEAVNYVWNDGEWRAAWESLKLREKIIDMREQRRKRWLP